MASQFWSHCPRRKVKPMKAGSAAYQVCKLYLLPGDCQMSHSIQRLRPPCQSHRAQVNLEAGWLAGPESRYS